MNEAILTQQIHTLQQSEAEAREILANQDQARDEANALVNDARANVLLQPTDKVAAKRLEKAKATMQAVEQRIKEASETLTASRIAGNQLKLEQRELRNERDQARRKAITDQDDLIESINDEAQRAIIRVMAVGALRSGSSISSADAIGTIRYLTTGELGARFRALMSKVHTDTAKQFKV